MKKLILSHRGALQTKYGSKLATVDAALQRMVAADAGRSITTIVEFVDTSNVLGTKKVKKATDAAAVKRAVDLLCAHHGEPDYVMLLGAPDVLPHQPLANPLPVGPGEHQDPDPEVWSDLPYACAGVYSTRIEDFLGPTRAVGRLPDIEGGSDGAYLIGLLDAASAHRPASKPGKTFALSAQVWDLATREVTKQAFGTVTSPRICPTNNAPVPGTKLRLPLQLINCHGGLSDPQFYGDDGSDPLPVAIIANGVKGVSAGTVVAAECCYGADLYAPKGVAMSICNTYLGEGAIAFLGATTVAYGAVDSSLENADVLCARFLKLVRDGSSLGRALLEARLQFLREVKPYSGVELKTHAQFVLLGDPSLRAIDPPGKPSAVVPAKKKAAKAKGTRAASASEASAPGLEGVARFAMGIASILKRHADHRSTLAAAGSELRAWAASKQLRVSSTNGAAGAAAAAVGKAKADKATTPSVFSWTSVGAAASAGVEKAVVTFLASASPPLAAKSRGAKTTKAVRRPDPKGAKRVELLVKKFVGEREVASTRLARR